MFKILSEAAKGISAVKQLDAAGKLIKSRPYSSKSKKPDNKGLTDFSQRKECQQKACMDRSMQQPPKDPSKPSCEKQNSPKTWRTCPEPPEPKEFSCSDVIQEKVPKRKKRAVASRPACSQPSPSLAAPECVKVKQELCPRTTAPGCKKAKIPPRCDPKKSYQRLCKD